MNKKDEEIEEIVAEEVPEEESTEAISNEKEEEILELKEEIEKLRKEFLYKAAEFENSRARILRDKENAVQYANESLLKDLLDPIDNLKRAYMAEGDTESIKEGVKMVSGQILSMLSSSYGLEMYSPEPGDSFDPMTMEAIALIEKEGIEKEEVGEVYLAGYKLKGRVLRPAKVVVAKPNGN